jgi:SAM-dependent methyltransferase
MHPVFQGIYCTPGDHRPLHYAGTRRGDRWTDGVLHTAGEDVRYAVEGGVPMFVPPGEDPWGDDEAVAALFQEHGIERATLIPTNWTRSLDGWRERRDLSWFERIVASLGRAMIIATGPGGSHLPQILDLAPESTVLLNDIGRWVVVEWARFAEAKGCWPGLSCAQFDARRMPLATNSLDSVDSSGGIVEIGDPEVLLPEVYRVLKPGGRLTLSEGGGIASECLAQFPEEGMRELHAAGFARGGPSLEEHLCSTGFEIAFIRRHEPRAMNLGRSTLADIAEKYGVKLLIAGQQIEARKAVS